MIVIDTTGIKPLVDRLQASSRNFPRDARRALTSVRRSTQTEVSRAIVEQYTVKRRAVLANLKASNVDSASLSFEIRGLRAPIGLHQFEHLASPMLGVSVQVKRGNGGKRLPSAFKTTVGNFGGGGSSARIFQRAFRNGKQVGRLPIKALFGPSAADMLDAEPVRNRVVDFMQTKLSTEIERLIQVAING